MDKLGDIVGKRLNQHKLGGDARASLVLHQADSMMQEKFNCEPTELKALRLKDGVLTIGSVSSVWSQELWSFQDELKRSIRLEHGQKSVSKILIKALTIN